MKRDISISHDKALVGLLPVCGDDPRVLILGSFPSVISLEGTRYYGNPQNRFWRIMGDLFLIDASLPYGQRIEQVKAHRIALWDVIHSCSRKGSADTRIRDPVFNEIGAFLAARPGITLVALNGTTAARYFRQACGTTGVDTVLLPSTSPAHARSSYEEKLERWNIIKNAVR
ncbi:DNA-deoxyinosine glycosylase [uncultured Methanoregula sp.]|uniref:DNA-deoxyinosine glycosylase n=1 Tax=uncultured Methanoregula sp. TaxID=1005933 RepID=UPI002AAC1A9A|nr:DNA-deoxyinosine glycosylase [uncultured Methanoregula sp.]